MDTPLLAILAYSRQVRINNIFHCEICLCKIDSTLIQHPDFRFCLLYAIFLHLRPFYIKFTLFKFIFDINNSYIFFPRNLVCLFFCLLFLEGCGDSSSRFTYHISQSYNPNCIFLGKVPSDSNQDP